jgi:predicted transcriptional regulator
MSRNFLVVDPEEDIEVLKGLASPIRVRILKLLHVEGPLNGNDIGDSWADQV